MEDASPEMLSIFAGAIERPSPEERAAFLGTACGSDVGLRRRIEALVRAHDEAGGFLRDRPVSRDPAATVDRPASEGPGSVVGPYKLREEIGEGGMGLVFVAEQQHPVRRKVALKVIKPGMDTRQVVARFEAERQALALMDHPNICHVLDGGTTDSGRPYFVMELVKGVPITQFCDAERLPVRQRLGLFLDVGAAIQHAHQKGIIHRDVKPGNVLVTSHDGTPVVKVIDFGVAKAIGQQLTEKTVYTQMNQMVGTPAYLSPEQAGQSGLDVDTRTDVYALGVLLYELLTGSTPIDCERLRRVGFDEMRHIIREEEPARPSTRISTLGLAADTVSANRRCEPKVLSRLVRGELDWIVMKALEKDRNRRYESASAFAADVRRYLDDEPVLACPPSAAYRLRKFVRRHRGPVLAASLVALALVGGIVAATWGLLRATDAEARAVTEAKQKEDALADARDKLFLALLSQARAERKSGQVGQRFEALRAIRRAAQIRVTAELRTEAIAAMALPDVEVAHEWEGWPEDSVGVGFDGRFESYARQDNRGGVAVCRLKDGREEVVVRLPAHGEPAFGPVLMSPDGRFVAYAHGKQGATFAGVRVWKLPDGAKPAVLLDEPAGMHEIAMAFHPNGRHLAIGHPDRTVSVYDLATGRPVHRLRAAGGAAPAHHLAFHPRESRLAVAWGNAVRLFDTDTGRELAALKHPPEVTWTSSVAWHPDGRRLAAGCDDRKIHVWDTETRAEVMPPWHHGDLGICVAFDPVGDRLVSIGWGNVTWLWDATAGRVLLKMPGNFGLRFSADGRLLGPSVSGARIRLWRVACGRELVTLRVRGAADRQLGPWLVVHPDGRTLAANSERAPANLEGRQYFFDLATGEELASIRWPGEYGDYPLFFHAPGPPPGRDGQETEGPGGWVTGGRGGLLLWPARPDPDRTGGLIVGPPRPFAPGLKSPFSREASASQDSRVVAVPDTRFTTVLQGRPLMRRWRLGPQHDVRFTAVSPDGRWVVTGSHWEDGRSWSCWIWDTRSGEKVHELPLRGSTVARFSPDGRWLMTQTTGSARSDSRLWEVPTWREVRRFDFATFAFSPDGRLLALDDVFGVIRLVETATGREVARLTGPEPMGYPPACFTPDGMRLVASCTGRTALYVWDLRLIRKLLKELDLDWEWPEFAPVAGGPRRPPPSVRVVGAEGLADWVAACNRAEAHGKAGRWDEVASAYSVAIERMPADGRAWFGRGVAHAWLGRWKKAAADFEQATRSTADDAMTRCCIALVRLHLGDRDGYRKACAGMLERFGRSTDPDEVRWVAWTCVLGKDAVDDWGPVVALAEKRLAADPKDCERLQALGAVLYRAGRLDEAAKRLAEADAAFAKAKRPLSSPIYTHLFLAMTQHDRGRGDEARRWLASAVKEIEAPPKKSPDGPPVSWNRPLTLQLLRREAEDRLKK